MASYARLTPSFHQRVSRWIIEEWQDHEWIELGYVNAHNDSQAIGLARTELGAGVDTVLRATAAANKK